MDILTVLKEKYPDMTKKQKQIADFMMAYPEQMTFITLKELSSQVNATEVTILKACSDFGYDNFNEVKYEFRKYASMQEQMELHQENDYMTTSIPKYELQEKEKLMQDMVNEEKELVNSMAAHLKVEDLMETARMILASRRLVICGRGFSTLLGKAFGTWINAAGVASVVMDTERNDEIHSLLPMIDEETTVLLISFPDYYSMTTKVAEFAGKSGAKVIGFTNMPDSPITRFCDKVLVCPSTTRLFLNTLSAPMAYMNLLASAVVVEMSAMGKHVSSEERFSELFCQ